MVRPFKLQSTIDSVNLLRADYFLCIDLWGRGYTDTPLDVPHDSKLFSMQILFAAASSPLSWTGTDSGGFSIVGFSLGGAIAMAFIAYFPELINSIILLAPGGILRYLPAEYVNPFFRYSYLAPFSYLRRLVGLLLGVSLSPAPIDHTNFDDDNETGPEVVIEAKPTKTGVIDIPAIVQWQFDHHKGFVHSFINTIRHGPLMNEYSDWKKACNVIKGDSVTTTLSSRSSKLFDSKILVIFGDIDGVVVEKDVSEDLVELLGGPEHVEFRTVSGGHGFPIPSSDEVVKHISEFWDLHVTE